MSAEEAVTDALQKPISANDAAAEDARKMLAEIEAEGAVQDNANLKPKKNGAAEDGKAEEHEPQNTEDITGKSDKKPEEDAEQQGDKDQDEGQNKGKLRERRYSDRRDRDRRESGHRGGRGGGKYQNRRDGIKSVVTSTEKSNDPAAIRKQVEFYFSDSNLPMDQFLLDKVGGSKNNPVELDIICTFKRMRHFEPREAVVEALKSSKTLNLVDDDTKVQRKQPLPESNDNGVSVDHLRVYEDKAMPRSVYVKGFGEEIPSTQFDVEAFFSEYGPTNAIRLRRTDTKAFKGSVFVEFENEELAEAFLAIDPKPQFKGRDLQIMSKQEYCTKKVEDIKAGKIKSNYDRDHASHRHRGGREGGRGSGRDRDSRKSRDDDRDWRVRRDEDRKNGFRDGKRRDNRDRRSGGKEQSKSEVDERGIPMVKIDSDQPKRDSEAAKKEAIAKARAMVEAEQKKHEANGNGAVETEAVTTEVKGEKAGDADIKTETESSKKRDREDDVTDEPPTKKVDLKEEA